jgi:hypothetical protein
MYGVPLINATLSTNTTNWTISSIPQGYKHLYMVFAARTAFTQHGPQSRWSWNNESSTNTHFAALENGTGFVYGPEAGSFNFYIPNYSNTSIKKTISSWATGPFGGALDGLPWADRLSNCFDNTTALSSLVLQDNSGSIWSAGSRVYIYGLSG